MGSRATADAGMMRLVLGELRRRDQGLFFLDSSTTPYSAVPVAARGSGMRVLRNNLFLDGGDEGAEPASVRVDRVTQIARREGQVVAIGHVRRETVAAVRDALDGWRAGGFALVGVSELASR
jgi:polysaccharide deacetylase 2 family uncharacterized protein YibQ